MTRIQQDEITKKIHQIVKDDRKAVFDKAVVQLIPRKMGRTLFCQGGYGGERWV